MADGDSDSDEDLFAPGFTYSWGKTQSVVAPHVRQQMQQLQQQREEQQRQQLQQQQLLQQQEKQRQELQEQERLQQEKQQQHQQSRGSHRMRSRSRSGHRQVERPSEFLPGTRVRLHSLKGAAHLNGQFGSIDMFMEGSKRWRVTLDAGGGSKDLKSENLEMISPSPAGEGLHLGCTVKLHGLRAAVELNGREGIVEEFVSSTSRWRIKIDNGMFKDLKAENLEVIEDEVVHVEIAPASTIVEKAENEPKKADPEIGVCNQQQEMQPETHEFGYEPGFYIVCDPGVRLNDGPSLNDNAITTLPAGTRIEVLEVVIFQDSKRIRARIEQPSGWISLFNIENGQKFVIQDASRASTQWQSPEFSSKGIALKRGEVLGPGNRFIVSDFLGEGKFSTVWRCKDTISRSEYAIKFSRSEFWSGAADAKERRVLEREVELMSLMIKHASKDAEGSKYLLCMMFNEGFEHNGHLGLVFESMRYSLLTALDRHGKGRGLPLLPTVRDFGKHLFLALRALKLAGLVHSDIKPENLLLAKDGASIKLGDFGNTMTVREAENLVDEFQMPLFYRAPEVILGQKFGTPIDIWGAAATIYQMATDRFLFTPQTNNEMIHEMLKVCGAFPTDVIATGRYVQSHFDAAGNFLLYQAPTLLSSNFAGKATGELQPSVERIEVASFDPPARPMSESLKILSFNTPPGVPPERHELLVGHLEDLLLSCFRIDPKIRVTPQDALKHRFFAKGAGDAWADLAVAWAQHDASQTVD